MVSFQTPLFQLNQRKTILETDSNSKKRKWDNITEDVKVVPYKHWMNPKAAKTTKSFYDIELHLETPLPSEWQRCLDIQSGEIHFYNTRTQKRTVRDPREESPEPPTPTPRDCYMSLDLELNLPCGSLNRNSSSKSSEEITPTMKKKTCNNSPKRAATDLFKCLQNTVESKSSTNDTQKEDEEAEMVAAACMRCHMLVMLQKSSPTCPNCKYVHPPYQSPAEMFKPKLSLSC